MYIIGRRGYGRESYPIRNPGGLGAQAPFVQLSLSADVPYGIGDPTAVIPFNTVVYESAAFGGFESVPELGQTLFTLPFGAYLSVLQINLTENDAAFGAAVGIQSLSGADAGGDENAVTSATISLSAIRLSSETPFTSVRPCAVIPSFLAPTVGAPGNIRATLTKLFIWQLQGF